MCIDLREFKLEIIKFLTLFTKLTFFFKSKYNNNFTYLDRKKLEMKCLPEFWRIYEKIVQ